MLLCTHEAVSFVFGVVCSALHASHLTQVYNSIHLYACMRLKSTDFEITVLLHHEQHRNKARL